METNNKEAYSYYYSLQPVVNETGSCFAIESGWINTSSWKYKGNLSSSCDYRGTVWTRDEDGITLPDRDYELVKMVTDTPLTGEITQNLDQMFSNVNAIGTGEEHDNSYLIPSGDQSSKNSVSSNVNANSAVNALAFSIYSVLDDKEELYKWVPEDSHSDVDALYDNYPAITRDQQTDALHIVSYGDSKERSYGFGKCYYWRQLGGSSTTESYACRMRDLDLLLPDINTIFDSLINNQQVKPGVKNLTLFSNNDRSAFNFSWEFGPSLIHFPFHGSYMSKGFAYFTVPVTGEYSFGSQSSGGVKLSLLDDTGTEISLLPNSAWEMRTTCTPTPEAMTRYELVRTTRYAGGNTSIHREDLSPLVNHDTAHYITYGALTNECINNISETIWGDTVYLEAKKPYPLQLSLWAGWGGFELELKARQSTLSENEITLDHTYITRPKMERGAFDTEKGWHAPLEKTGHINFPPYATTISASVAGQYNIMEGSTLSAQLQIQGSQAIVDMAYDDGSGTWKQLSETVINYSGAIKESGLAMTTIQSMKERLAVVISTENQLGGVIEIIEQDPTGQWMTNTIPIEGNVELTGDVAISSDGTRLAVGTDDSVIIYEESHAGEWSQHSSISINGLQVHDNQSIRFNPSTSSDIYIATENDTIHRFQYSVNEWMIDATFVKSGNKIAFSGLGTALAVSHMQERTIDLYTLDYSGNPIYANTVFIPDTSDIDQIALSEFMLAVSSGEKVYIYSTQNIIWENIDPNWRVINTITTDKIQSLWVAPSGVSGAQTIGVGTTMTDLYRLNADELASYDGGEWVSISLENHSYDSISGSFVSFVIVADDTLTLQLRKGQEITIRSDSRPLEWLIDDQTVEYKACSYSFSPGGNVTLSVNDTELEGMLTPRKVGLMPGEPQKMIFKKIACPEDKTINTDVNTVWSTSHGALRVTPNGTVSGSMGNYTVTATYVDPFSKEEISDTSAITVCARMPCSP